jgi:hypothetical protein
MDIPKEVRSKSMSDSRPLPTSTNDPAELQVTYRNLPVDHISFPRGLWDPLIPPLTESGYPLAVPIIVASSADSTYTIIDGCKRLQKARDQGRVSIGCGIIVQNQPVTDRGLLRILLNCGRLLHIREKLLFQAWLRQNTDQQTCRSMLGRLGMTAREQHDLEPLIDCRLSVVEAVVAGWLHLPNLRDFLLFSADEGDLFISLFQSLKLSQQMQREWIEWCQEIAAAESITVESVLMNNAIQAIVENTDLTAPQRIEKARQILFARRFPRLTATEAAWKELVRLHNPKPGVVTFCHDPNFEHNRLTVQVSIAKPEEARRVFGGLAQITSEIWDRLLFPLADQWD